MLFPPKESGVTPLFNQIEANIIFHHNNHQQLEVKAKFISF